jgi:hypothetical protein
MKGGVKMKYLWWISHDGKNAGSMGSWSSKRKAQQAIKDGLKDGLLSNEVKWYPVKHELDTCPTCGRLAEKDIIDGLGECLSCDHVRGDVMDDMYEECEEDENDTLAV